MDENQALVAKKFETNTQNIGTRIGSQIYYGAESRS